MAGGILENPTHEIEVACDPSVLPERINIDVSSLEVNHAIHVRDLPAMENVKILASPDTVIAAVKYAKKEVEAVVATAEAGAAEAGAEVGADAKPVDSKAGDSKAPETKA